MAAKKSGKKSKSKLSKKIVGKAKAVTPSSTKKAVKKVAKKAKGLLDKLTQRSAQLIIDTGLLGEAPKRSSKRTPSKKKTRKAV